MRPRRYLRTVIAAILVSLLSASVALACTCGSSASAGCITTLPVNIQLPSPFAGSYHRTIAVIVETTGPPIRNLRGTLYTFHGVEIASGKLRRTVFSSNRLKLHIRPGFPTLQAGSFTLGLFGEPNPDPSCGPKHTFRVVRFLPCLTTLPVSFPRLPGGTASDYGSTLSLTVASRGFVLRGVAVSLSRFDGTLVGTKRIGLLYGEVTVTFNFPGGLQPGGYTAYVTGDVKDQPTSCGAKAAKAVMTFK